MEIPKDTDVNICQALILETGGKCCLPIDNRETRSGNPLKFCRLHQITSWANYHRFDCYYAKGSSCLAILGRTVLGSLAILLREDLKELLYRYVKAFPKEEIYYQMAEREDIQNVISQRVSEYFSPDWKKHLVSRIAPEAKILGPDLLRGELSACYNPLDFNTLDRMANILLRIDHYRQSSLQKHRRLVVDALFLVMALEEIVLQERLECYLLSSGEKLPLEKEDEGDIHHCIPAIECKAIVTFLRQFLPEGESGNEAREIFLSSADWERVVRWLLSREPPFSHLIPFSFTYIPRSISPEGEKTLAFTRDKICEMGELLEGWRKNNSHIQAKVMLKAKDLYEITSENIAEAYDVENYTPVFPREEVRVPLRFSRYEEKLYAHFYWRKENICASN